MDEAKRVKIIEQYEKRSERIVYRNCMRAMKYGERRKTKPKARNEDVDCIENEPNHNPASNVSHTAECKQNKKAEDDEAR